VKNSILVAFLACCAHIIPIQHTLAQTPNTPAFLSGTWTCSDSASIQAPGQIPGSLHQSLLRAGIIPDPFIGTNEEEIQWVGTMNWTFTSDPFEIPQNATTLEAENVQLYSTWHLNGKNIGSTDNAFLSYSFNLESSKRSTNVLRVEFTPPSDLSSEKLATVGHPLPGDAQRAVHRMPQFAFGWDWGPKLLDMCTQSLSYSYGDNAISNVNLETVELSENKAICSAGWTLSGVKGSATMRWALTNSSGVKVAWGNISGEVGDHSDEFTLEFPDLWWTHDLGTPHLYKLEVIALNKTGLIGRTSARVGIRTLELDTEDGAFQFILNGQPIYSQGSNVVPCDIIPNRISNREEHAIIDAAIAANMNTLRVWGGGLYASDNFMDYCDEKGMLVWHDFMFACAMYPADDAFLNSVSTEAKTQCLRLRHHPSLALWCGNNEVSEGWERWGWKAGLSSKEIKAVSESYSEVFIELLPKTVSKFDDAPYWESSPMLGRGDAEFKNQGDAHDWGIWHDGYSFDSLWTRVPRYMSEYGFQSFPLNSTFESILSHDSIMQLSDFKSHPEVVAHEKHSRGFDIIDAYMNRTHGAMVCDTILFEDWTYLSRVIQAEGIAEGAIAGRLNQNHCSGTLVWQLNDCWPVASWSSIDGHGRWKLLHNELKKAFSEVLLHGRWIGESLQIGLVANPGTASTTQGQLILDLVELNEEILKTEVHNIDLTPGETSWLNLQDLYPDNPNSSVIHLRWNGENGLSAEDRVYCVQPGELDLKKGSIFIKKFGWSGDSYHFEISANTYVKSVELYSENEGNFSINNFDLFPEEPIRVSFNTIDVNTFAPGSGSNTNSSTPVIFARSLNDFVTK